MNALLLLAVLGIAALAFGAIALCRAGEPHYQRVLRRTNRALARRPSAR
jgi:hypothetical protein